MNKRSEVVNLIDTHKPHILALTEFGASDLVGDGELGIDGYTLYRGNQSDGSGGLGRGVALYVMNTLNHSAYPAVDGLAFDCSVWTKIKLAGNKSLLVGVVYRSPNSTNENNQNMLQVLRTAASANCQYLTICGDFNLPLIDWNTKRSLESENALSSKFMELIEELSLFQHAHGPTRFRGEQNSCLDLIMTNEECMVNEVKELPPIGKSDHICQQWNVVVSEAMFRNTSTIRPNFRQAKWMDLKADIRNHENDARSRPSVMYDKFVSMIKEVKAKHVPNCRARTNKHRLPWIRSPGIKKQVTTMATLEEI